MTPRRKSARARRKNKIAPNGEHNAMVLFEQTQAQLKLVLEAVQDRPTRTEFGGLCTEVDVLRTEFHDFRTEVRGHLTLVIGELRAVRSEMAGFARAADLRALEARVTVLEQRANP